MDLSILKTVNKPETIAPEEYVPPTDFSEPINVIGDYVVRILDGKFKDRNNPASGEDPFRLTTTKNGDLQAEVALEVVDGPFKGKRLYDRINTAAFKSGNKGNTWFNFLMAFGNQDVLSDPADYVKALERIITKGRTAKVFVSLEWYSNPKAQDYQGTGNSYKYKDAVDGGWLLPDGIRITEPGTTNILLGRNTLGKYRAANAGSQV
jgi:hypothetical protein